MVLQLDFVVKWVLKSRVTLREVDLVCTWEITVDSPMVIDKWLVFIYYAYVVQRLLTLNSYNFIRGVWNEYIYNNVKLWILVEVLLISDYFLLTWSVKSVDSCLVHILFKILDSSLRYRIVDSNSTSFNHMNMVSSILRGRCVSVGIDSVRIRWLIAFKEFWKFDKWSWGMYGEGFDFFLIVVMKFFEFTLFECVFHVEKLQTLHST